METEQHQGQENEFGTSQWVEMGGYSGSQHQSPLHEYGGFGFVSPTIMPVEPSYSMSIPPPYTSHQQLQPLIMPVPHVWPSMMTSQANYSAPLLPTTSASAPTSAISAPPPPPMPPIETKPTTTPRKTLTNEDRRRMCLYHEEHPGVKQTEIGSLFGVERSTVSKVLRQKEKFLYPDDGSRSPIKRSKGKFPDIERALSNWARNHQKQGFALSDNAIRDKARFFATTVGNSESHHKVNSNSWLEKFKQKNNLLGAKSRKGSTDATATDSDGGVANADSSTTSSCHTPNGTTPISPSGATSPSPMSPTRSQDSFKNESPSDGLLDFSYRHGHSQSATSLHSFSDTTAPPLSGGATSPTSPYFSSDPSCGPSPFTPTGISRLPPLNGSAFARPRSQTFPTLGIEPGLIATQTTADQLTPKNYLQQAMDAPVLESPLEDLSNGIDPIQTVIKRNHSNPDIKTSMQPPPLPRSNSATVSPTISSPGSPTPDEARKALETVMIYFKNQPMGLVDPQEYIAIGKLMEKLKLVHTPGIPLPGGLHRIEEDEATQTHVRKKRSIHSL